MSGDPVLIVGAGLSGATVARVLAEHGIAVEVVEQAPHPGGMCHTSRDAQTGVMVHRHGPHIFHCDNDEVWRFVEHFARFEPYAHAVMAITGGKTFGFPITLDTIEAFFGQLFTEAEARDHIAALRRDPGRPPANFEEMGRATVGDALYEAFFHGYTLKQWGVSPASLPAAIFARVPVRFNRNRSYFHHQRVAMPREGYTAMIEAMLAHARIRVDFNRAFTPGAAGGRRHVVYTGPIDSWFGHALGRLSYRTLDFAASIATGSQQPVAQINCCDLSASWTRTTEHNRFAPWERHDQSYCAVETSRDCGPGDTPYYPVRLAGDEALFGRYRAAARREAGVSFVGRLATYRYIDMDVAIAEGLSAGRRLAGALRSGETPPAFFHEED